MLYYAEVVLWSTLTTALMRTIDIERAQYRREDI